MITTSVLAVFVPGALAGGLLVSIGLLVADGVARLRGDRAALRSTAVRAEAIAADVRHGHGAAASLGTARRSRSTYRLVALVTWGLVALAVPGATWNFFNPGGYISDISWMWVTSALATTAVGVVAVTAVRLQPDAAPLAALAIGLGGIVRFAVGPEGFPPVVVALVGTVATASAWVVARRWQRRRPSGLPAAAVPLLARTALGRREST